MIDMGLRELQPPRASDVPSEPSFCWSTVSAFKGLESDVVVLAGLDEADSDWWRAVAYVGMSRATCSAHYDLAR